MLRPRLIALSALSLAALATTGCPTEPACDLMAVASLNVTLVDIDGIDITEADVSFSSDGGGTFAPCDEAIVGEWVCGYEVAGEITVRAESVGYTAAEQTVTIAEDECHVIGQDLQLTLEEAPIAGQWEEPRSYYIQLIEDPDECANSWDLYGMNCYQMAYFCPSGEATVIVTDIANRGTYSIDGDDLQIDWSGAVDVPHPFGFTIADDESLIDTTGSTWTWDVQFEVVGAPYCDTAGGDAPLTAQ